MVGSSSTSRFDGSAKRAGQRQPAALAAGQHADRRARLLGREQEVLHVADHVPALAADRHRVAAPAGQRVGQASVAGPGSRGAGRASPSREVGAEPDLAGVRRQLAGQQVEQRGLAGAVRADHADPVAAHDPRSRNRRTIGRSP